MLNKKKKLLKWRAMSSHTVELGCFFVYSKRKKMLDRWHDYLAWQKRAVCQTSGLFSVISGSTFHVYGPLKDNLFNSPCNESTQHPVHLWMQQTKRGLFFFVIHCERGGGDRWMEMHDRFNMANKSVSQLVILYMISKNGDG